MVESFWKPKKMRMAKFNDGLKVRSIQRKNAWFGDADKDKVVNIFDCAPNNRRKQGWQHQGHVGNREETTHVVMMSPDKFLRTTYREVNRRGLYSNTPGVNSESFKKYKENLASGYQYSKPTQAKKVGGEMERLQHVIKQPKGKMEIPYLNYDEQGYPTGHEGRHRAMAAEAEGVKLMPVTVFRRLPEREYRDWEQRRKEVGAKDKDWRLKIENEDQAISSKSADISIAEQRIYGEEQPQALQSLNNEESESGAGEYEPVREDSDE